MKKVLGLVVSERNLGNSELLVKEIMGAVPDPCSREMIRLTELGIGPCRACYRCLTPGTECRVNDHFKFVIDKITGADALVIGMPVYFLGPHGQFKMLTDRLMGVGQYAEKTRGKPCVVVIPYGLAGWEGYARTAALVLPRMLEMKLVDCWPVHATLPGEGVMKEENCEYARRLGAGIFTAGEYSGRPGECPYCGADLFRLLPGGVVECCLCSAKGYPGAGGSPEFRLPGHYRFSTEGMQEHFMGWLVKMREKYLAERESLKEVQKPYRGSHWWVKPENSGGSQS
ncbi:MAG: flavodoxin family protein [Bacillota bacterium]